MSNGQSKPVTQYTTGGIKIVRYPSAGKASLATGISRSRISECCVGLCDNAGGFIWSHANTPLTKKHSDKRLFTKQGKHKEYMRKWKRTDKGCLRTMYDSQRTRSRTKQWPVLNYTFKEWVEWCYANGFQKLYDEWVSSDYQKGTKPSGDRLNNSKPYTLDNLQLVTWRENDRLGHLVCEKPVTQRTLDGQYVADYESCPKAAIALGRPPSRGCIIASVCINPKKYTAYGYVWHYKDEPYDLPMVVISWIHQYTMDDIWLASYVNPSHAAKWLGLSSGNHISACGGGSKPTAYGYIWKRHSDPISKKQVILLSNHQLLIIVRDYATTKKLISQYQRLSLVTGDVVI